MTSPALDVFLALEDNGLKLLLGEVGGQVQAGGRRRMVPLRHRAAQVLDNGMDIGHGLVVMLP